MPPSDTDAETEKLIAQLIASDLEESYQSSSAPIGASWEDYEEPLSSYERQCLDAENCSDGESEGGGGWGWGEDSGGVNGAAPDQGLSSTEPNAEGTWNSSFINDEGLVQDHSGPAQTPPAWNSSFVNEEGLVQDYPGLEQTLPAAGADDDDSDSDSSSDTTNEADLPVRIVSLPPYSVLPNSAGETRNLSAPMTLPSQRDPDVRSGEAPEPCESSAPCEPPIPCESHEPDGSPESSDHASQGEPLTSSIPSLSTDSVPASHTEEVEDQWNDGWDYSSHKGKGNAAVRAYDEYKQGMRGGGWESWDPKVAADPEFVTKLDEADWNHDGEDEEGEIDDDDEDPTLIHIPWPHVEPDESLARREDAEVAEIRVGDDETLESILKDISLREERREKGKEAEVRGGQTEKKDVVAWW